VTARIKLRLKKPVPELGATHRKFMAISPRVVGAVTVQYHHVLLELWDEDTDMHT
jgi:hypothetical protein